LQFIGIKVLAVELGRPEQQIHERKLEEGLDLLQGPVVARDSGVAGGKGGDAEGS
jgi:hypothetical protein